MLLPYIENAAVYNAINFSITSYRTDSSTNCTGGGPGWCNSTSLVSVIESFLCPSDRWGHQGTIFGFRYPGQNYLASGGDNVTYSTSQNPSVNRGIFWLNSNCSTRDIFDGTAFTVAFSERLKGSNDRTVHEKGDVMRANNIGLVWPVNPINSAAMPASLQTSAQFDGFVNQCDTLARPLLGTGEHFVHPGRHWIIGQHTFALFNTVLTPNSPHFDCMIGGCGEFDCAGLFTASSNHPGGVNVLMADGQVRFVSDNVDQRIWWAVGSKSGRESIDNASF
jgi:prepilin-type processing-associated H-X9-DG protein